MYPISIDYAHFSHCLQYRLRDGGACTADESVWVGHGMGGGTVMNLTTPPPLHNQTLSNYARNIQKSIERKSGVVR